MRTVAGRWAMAMVLLFVVAGCGGDGTPAAPEVDRLVVADLEDRAVTMARDGSDAVVVSDEGEVVFQPVWSPDGAFVAWGSARDPALAVAAADGSGTRRVARASVPFYLFWSPAGDRIGVLRADPAGIAFDLAEVGEEELTVEEVDTGQPYYFSWSPDGEELVVHVGTDRFELAGIDGDYAALGVTPGRFQAPQWGERGIVAPVIGEGGQELVVVDPSGGVESIVAVDGAASFALDEGGELLAVQGFVPDQGGGAIEAALADEPLRPNRLHVVDLEDEAVDEVTVDPAVAFWWSPVGGRLLVLEPADEQGELRWRVWEEGEASEGPSFVPPPRWLGEFLPFFDQYARSMTLWAPDGSAYAFPGAVDGSAGIWVVDLETGTEERVADGTWVAWSRN